MKTFRLLSNASCVAIVVCLGTAQAAPLLDEVPLVVDTISGDDIAKLGTGDISELLYLAPSVSVFGGGSYAPEIGAGIKLRGIGDPRLNLSIEGSAALYQPGSVEELWIGSRLGFTLDDINKIEIVGSSSVGLIGGTPSYRFGIGGEIPVLTSADLFIEGTAAGHFGGSPTDIGIRGGLHFFPGRITELDQLDVLNGPSGGLYGSGTGFYAGGSVTVMPGAGAAVPAIDFGATLGIGNGFDIGPRVSLGLQVPANNYEAWLGVEAGYQVSRELRAHVFGELGTIGGGGPYNRIGIGGEYRIDPSIALVGELSGRGAIGDFGEFGAKFGFRHYFNLVGTDLALGIPDTPGINGFVPYVGKSISALNTGDFIPALDFGIDFPFDNGFVKGARGQIGYQLPAAIIEGWVGGKLGYQVTPEFVPYVFGDIGTIGGAGLYNRVGVGGDFSIDQNWGIKAEVFGRGSIGNITEGGITAGLRYAFSAPVPD
jgi:hypothetical protein